MEASENRLKACLDGLHGPCRGHPAYYWQATTLRQEKRTDRAVFR